MTVPDALDAARETVYRLLGWWVVRFQSLETQLKRLVAESRIEGRPEELDQLLRDAQSQLNTRSAGAVRDALFKHRVVASTQHEELDEAPPHGHDGAWLVWTRKVRVEPDTLEMWVDDLTALINQRNDLIHHFDQMFDLDSLESCRRASEHLRELHESVDRQYARYLAPSTLLQETLQDYAAVAATDEYKRLVNEGIAPDGSIVWAATPIVAALHEAADLQGTDGWLAIAQARRWIEENHPKLTPAGVGCKTWQQVIHHAGQFQIRRVEVDGHIQREYRTRPGVDRSIEIKIELL